MGDVLQNIGELLVVGREVRGAHLSVRVGVFLEGGIELIIGGHRTVVGGISELLEKVDRQLKEDLPIHSLLGNEIVLIEVIEVLNTKKSRLVSSETH